MWRYDGGVRWIVPVVCALGGCDAILGLSEIPPIDSPPPVVPSYRKPITITQSTSSTLEMFRISIVLASDSELAMHAQTDGNDILFTDSTGANELPSEIVAYDSGALEAWVAIPMLPPGDTMIYLAYGGSARTSRPSDVWAGQYAGVWHQSGRGPTETDSTSNDLGLTTIGSAPLSTMGVVGNGRHFVDQASDQLCGADSNGSLAFDITTSFTYEMWLNSTLFSGAAGVVLDKGGTSTGNDGFELELGSGLWDAHLDDGTNDVSAQGALPNAGWVQLVEVADRGNEMLTSYVDGARTETHSIGSLGGIIATEPFCLGGESDGMDSFGGDLDEVVVERVARTDDWIRFEYESITNRDQVIAVGAEQVVTD